MDLPFAMGRACSEAKSEHVIPLSCFRHREFMKTYGVEIAAGPFAGLCARSVIVLNASDKVIHAELVPELSNEPNYDAALNAVNPKTYKFAILGSGMVATALSDGLTKHGHSVKIGSRDPSKVKLANAAVGVGTSADVVTWADIVILAVKGTAALDCVKGVATQLAGKIVLDATNPAADQAPVNGVLVLFTKHTESLMELLQAAVPTAKFVKCWNSVTFSKMIDPKYENGRRPTMFICGNDADAKNVATGILAQVGWNTMDCGLVESARAIEPLVMLHCVRGFRNNQWDHAFDVIQK